MTDLAKDADTAVPPLTLGLSAWAIRREALHRIIEAHRSPDLARLADAVAARAAAPTHAARRAGSTSASGVVAVLPLAGVITPRGSMFSMLFGGGSGGLIGFREGFRAAVDSSEVTAIVLDVDSPGGLVDLVPETAAEIRDARGSKPIIAVANTLAASAAYYLAAQADEVVVTPSGDVGSIGVYRLHENWAGFNARTGIEPTYVHAGEYKVEGNMDEPLSDEALADWQQSVDDLYDMFVADVAAGRNVTTQKVLEDYGQGRTLNAARALEAGMVDRVDTLEAVIGGLLSPGAASAAAAAVGRRALAPQPRAETAAPEPAPSPSPESEVTPDPAPEDQPDEPPTAALTGAEAAALLDLG